MPQTTPEAALSETWLASTDQTLAFYRQLRDDFEPGKPIWLTETADAACGGNPWAATFLDTFRYLDQLGRLSSDQLQSALVQLNGAVLELRLNDELPELRGVATPLGTVATAPATITFLTMADAANGACR
jgi:hypothetical protein